jgi:glyoxylate reductase
LQSGQLGHYATDVTEPEPLPRDHPLLALRECTTITPHVGSATFGARRAMLQLQLRNLAAVLGGQRPPASPNYDEAMEARARRDAHAGATPTGDTGSP